jgi:hypothetical protein
MFSKKIYTCLEQLVGYNQPVSDCPPALSDFLTASESGLYFTDFSPFARVDYLQDVSPNYLLAQTANYNALQVWNNTTTYPAGTNVRDDLGQWEAVVTNINQKPSFESAFWKFMRFEPTLNGYLAETRRKAAKTILHKLFEDKIARGMTKTLIEEKFMFEGIGNPNHTEPNLSRFVGVEIKLQQVEGLKLVISQIGLQLTAPQTLNLYLYHRSQDAPLKIIPAQITAPYRFAWTNISSDPIEIYAREFNLSPGETYILGYYEEDLVGNAINKTVGNGCCFSKPCLTCGTRYEYLFWERYSKYVSFTPILVNNTYLQVSRDLPDLGESDVNLTRTFNKTFGLNFAISVRCELDSFICRNREMLSRLLGLQTIVLLMQEAEMNMRVNRTQTLAFDYILREKEALSNGQPSVYSELQQAYKAVSFDFSNFQSPCLPCENRPGVITSVI